MKPTRSGAKLIVTNYFHNVDFQTISQKRLTAQGNDDFTSVLLGTPQNDDRRLTYRYGTLS